MLWKCTIKCPAIHCLWRGVVMHSTLTFFPAQEWPEFFSSCLGKVSDESAVAQRYDKAPYGHKICWNISMMKVVSLSTTNILVQECLIWLNMLREACCRLNCSSFLFWCKISDVIQGFLFFLRPFFYLVQNCQCNIHNCLNLAHSSEASIPRKVR